MGFEGTDPCVQDVGKGGQKGENGEGGLSGY